MNSRIAEKARDKLRAELIRRRIDAYLAYTPENIHYLTGYRAEALETTWLTHGSEMALIAADPALDPVLITLDAAEATARESSGLSDIRTFPAWMEIRDLQILTETSSQGSFPNRRPRPDQYDMDALHDTFASTVRGLNLAGKTIGTDLGNVQKGVLEMFSRFAPNCRFVDVSDLLYELRSIKLPAEIERLQKAAMLFEAGVANVVANAREGLAFSTIKADFDLGWINRVRSDPTFPAPEKSWVAISFGPSGDLLRMGDILKLDCGVSVAGYYSDGCRTFSMGKPTADQRFVFDALYAGFHAAEKKLVPGITMAEIFHTAQDTIRAHGLPNYSRGHFGHSIGLASWVEEPPFISPNDQVLKPGMVMCLETPCFVPSVGPFNIEDMFLITEQGPKSMMTLPRELIEI